MLQKFIPSPQPLLLNYQLIPAAATLHAQAPPPLIDLDLRQAPYLQAAEGAPAIAAQEVRRQSEKLAAVHSKPGILCVHSTSHVLRAATELPCLVEDRENRSTEGRWPVARSGTRARTDL